LTSFDWLHPAFSQVERADWLKVALGFREAAFWRGEATSGSAAFRWYTERAVAAVEAAQARAEERVALAAGEGRVAGGGGGRVIVVGHSAGGWLARLAMLQADGPGWAGRHVACLATLGAPHAAPPPGVDDMTRGVLRSLERDAPRAACANQGVACACMSMP
jgi:pimeloyl-ACP methyl ester carboxylesterase